MPRLLDLCRFACHRLCLFAITVHAFCSPVFAQVPRNAGFESKTFAIVKARLVISPDEEIEQGTLVIRDGLIVAAGKEGPLPPDAEGIEGKGLAVYPGFIDAGTTLLLDPNPNPPPRARGAVE